jgi:hypothetical protein
MTSLLNLKNLAVGRNVDVVTDTQTHKQIDTQAETLPNKPVFPLGRNHFSSVCIVKIWLREVQVLCIMGC